MKIVIDISEEVYDSIKSNEEIITYVTKDGGGSKALHGSLAIINGTILPKGHGDLIDRDKLIEELMESDKTHAENSREETLLYRNRTIIREQSTIIEADKESD